METKVKLLHRLFLWKPEWHCHAWGGIHASVFLPPLQPTALCYPFQGASAVLEAQDSDTRLASLWLAKKIQNNAAAQISLWHQQHQSLKSVVVVVVSSLSHVWILRPHGLYPTRFLCARISQARILEWVAISFSRGSSPSKDRNCASCIASILYHWVTREAPKVYTFNQNNVQVKFLPSKPATQSNH